MLKQVQHDIFYRTLLIYSEKLDNRQLSVLRKLPECSELCSMMNDRAVFVELKGGYASFKTPDIKKCSTISGKFDGTESPQRK